MACAMVFDVEKACGIELFANLHQAANQQKQKLLKNAAYQKNISSISLLQGNFLAIDFSDANLIFINATGFIGPIWHKIQEKLIQLSPGTVIITISKKLNSNDFTLQKTTHIEMSWGIATAYIQQLKSTPT